MISSAPRGLESRIARAIDGDALARDAQSLPASARAVVGTTWRERMRQEHLAVGAFAMLTREAAEDGCDPVVLGLLAKAVADEVRHAEVCRLVAAALLGEAAVPRAWRGIPRIPAHAGETAAARTLLHVVEMCCLSETLTCVFFSEMVARASNPVARAAVESLLADEIDHSRAGWAYLATRREQIPRLAIALPAMLARTFGRALRDATPPIDDTDAMEAFGYVRWSASRAILQRALRDVAVPGFESLGVDLCPSRPVIAALLAPA